MTVEDWKNDKAENFAEDFKTYYSQKLGPYSFDTGEKSTNYEYNEKVGAFIEKSTKYNSHFNEPSIFDSQFVNDNFNLILDCCSTDEVDRELASKLEINYKHNDGDSYIELWDVNHNFIKKIKLENNEGQFELDIDDNVGIVIQYVKMGDKYEAYWRRDIK